MFTSFISDYIIAPFRVSAPSEVKTMAERGDIIIGEGKIKFGLEYRDLLSDQGVCIHALAEVDGEEVELLRFDCFDHAPHYHYGPRNKDIRIYWDTTLVPDTLEWTLKQFASGNLPNLIERAGYPGIVAELDKDLIISKVKDEIAPRALEIRAANAK